eukprot:TRINITY_DN23516_c0_g1_i2.p3 TRINITY_DN23516_c0_g1~~TRINITY_DN23516_c0_g1_i2.p3  ORF type:complete len:152 (-),score=20.04 TRINITY_DN23516_c0_g1_i2:37-492(-)
MQRGLVGSEMCIRDSINAEYMGGCIGFDWRQIMLLVASGAPTPKTSKQFNCQERRRSLLRRRIRSCCVSSSSVQALIVPLLTIKCLQQQGLTFISASGIKAVSYTHLTLPTILLVQISVVAVSLKKKNNKNNQYTLYNKKQKVHRTLQRCA